MKLNSKMTWGLAWAGLAVVVAVPSLDFMTGKAGGKTAAVVTSTTDPVIPAKPQAAMPVKTAAVTTKVTPSGITITPTAKSSADPVDDYLKTNKALPDYISGGGNTASADSGSADSSAPTQVATVDPTPPQIAPIPFPARPPDVVVPSGGATRSSTDTATSTSTSSPTAPQGSAPRLYAPADSEDDFAPPTQEATADPTGPVPPASIDDGSDWPGQGQGLQRYLSRNGLLSDGQGQSTATVTVVKRNGDNYDPDGFYLSDGPNDFRARRRARVERMLERQQEQNDGWLPNFSLF